MHTLHNYSHHHWEHLAKLMFTKPCPHVILMKALRQTSINIFGCWHNFKSTLDYHLLSCQDLLLQTLSPSCIFSIGFEFARGSLEILSMLIDSQLQYNKQCLWNAGQVTHTLCASLRGWMEKTCLSEPKINTLESSFRLIHYRPLAERANQASWKTFQTPKDTPGSIMWVSLSKHANSRTYTHKRYGLKKDAAVFGPSLKLNRHA